MRSESDGHCLPRPFPGLAVRAALAARSARAARRLGAATATTRAWTSSSSTSSELRDALRLGRELPAGGASSAFAAVDGGFELDGAGAVPHVLVAPGHPGLAMPPELGGDPRAVHAYEPHEYADEVAVVGAGMAAATEWLNALAAGASRRLGAPPRARAPAAEPARGRCSRAAGLAASTPRRDAERVALLRRSRPPRTRRAATWDEPIAAATREGRFRVESAMNGARQIICATGFRRGFQHDPLLRALVDEHGLETVGRGSCSTRTRRCRR